MNIWANSVSAKIYVSVRLVVVIGKEEKKNGLEEKKAREFETNLRVPRQVALPRLYTMLHGLVREKRGRGGRMGWRKE